VKLTKRSIFHAVKKWQKAWIPIQTCLQVTPEILSLASYQSKAKGHTIVTAACWRVSPKNWTGILQQLFDLYRSQRYRESNKPSKMHNVLD